MAFQGSLAELHLPDIIQLVTVSGKTGVFHLTDGSLRGQTYLRDGRIVHDQIEDVSGEEAVYTLAIWNQGEFRFEPGIATENQTITKSNTNLLMERPSTSPRPTCSNARHSDRRSVRSRTPASSLPI